MLRPYVHGWFEKASYGFRYTGASGPLRSL